MIKKTLIYKAIGALTLKGFRLPVKLTPQQEAMEICIQYVYLRYNNKFLSIYTVLCSILVKRVVY